MKVIDDLQLVLVIVLATTVSAHYQQNTAGKVPLSRTPAAIHYQCRNNIYCAYDRKIPRFPVPDDKVRWEVKWPEYRPVSFTDHSMRILKEFDPEIEESKNLIKFNTIDEHGLNRISYLGNYRVENSYPLNPVGRTGIRGKGVLPRWGPNHSMFSLLTRYKPSEKVEVGQKRTAQFLAVPQKIGKPEEHLGLLGGFTCSGENQRTCLAKEIYVEYIAKYANVGESDKEFLSELLDINSEVGHVINYYYEDSPINTDNAWIELTVKYFHDYENTKFRFIPEGDTGADMIPRWVDIHRNVSSFGINLLLSNIATFLNCHW